MKKRGQITAFIILGIFIAAVILLLLYSRSETEAAKILTQPDESSLFGKDMQNYLNACLEKTGKDALVYIGKHGGYYEMPDTQDSPSIPVSYDSFFMLPYYFYKDKSLMITKEELEIQISNYVDSKLLFCLNDFEEFKKMGYEIAIESTAEDTAKNIKTKSLLKDDKLSIILESPITVKKEEITKILLPASAEIPTRLSKVYDVINEFMQIQLEEPSLVCVSCITQLAVDNNFKAEIGLLGSTEENAEVMFKIIDENPIIGGEPYKFSFINYYALEKEAGEAGNQNEEES